MSKVIQYQFTIHIEKTMSNNPQNID